MNNQTNFIKIAYLSGLFVAFGVAGNYLNLSLVFGIDLIFGSVMTLLAVATLGILPGTVIGLLVGGYTWFLWGHPYAMLIFGAEALIVGLIYRRTGNLALSDGIYWVVLGVPLVVFFYSQVLDLEINRVAFVAAKQMLNGIFNAVVASLILFFASYSRLRMLSGFWYKTSARNILFHVLTFIALLSAAIPSVISDHNFLHELERDTRGKLNNAAMLIEINLKNTLPSRIAAGDDVSSAIQNALSEMVPADFGGGVPDGIQISDERGHVIATLGAIKSIEGRRINSNSHNVINVWTPDGEMAKMSRWRQSRYLLDAPINVLNDVDLNVRLELQTTDVITRHDYNSLKTLAILVAILVTAMLCAHFLSGFLTRPLRKIASESKLISENITGDVEIRISDSPLSEFDALVHSLKHMRADIVSKFNDLQAMKDTLEVKVEERTIELEKLAIVARQVSNAVLITDLDGKTMWVNEGFTRISGFTLDEIINQKPGVLLQGPESSLETINEMRMAIKNRKPFSVEIINYNKEKSPYWIEISCNPMLDKNGEIIGFIAIEADISDRKKIELQLLKSTADLELQLKETIQAQRRIEVQTNELVDLAEREGAARFKAENAERAKSEFLASMSHEIRTPMTGILGFADILLNEKLPSSAHDKIIKIKNSAKSLLTILNDILDLSKLDAGKFEIEKIDFNPMQVATEVTELFSQTCPAEKKLNLDFQSEFSDDFPEFVRSDPTRLRQVLINLMGNAVKFTDAGQIKLTCTLDDDTGFLRFTLSDSGIGIGKDAQTRLFDDFVQADASISRKYHGTGLGLSICKRLVELMGGRIGLSSEIGAGSTFWFTIPFEPVSDDFVKNEEEFFNPTKYLDAQALDILVAEDNDINQTVISAILSNFGHNTTFANNGLEALNAVKRKDFDLILMDVRMPEMSGPEATMHIRRLESPKCNIPIIALTADIMAENRQSYFEAGMNDCVGKPIDNDELSKAINKAAYEAADTATDQPDVDASSAQDLTGFDLEEVKSRLGLSDELLETLLHKFATDYGEVDKKLNDLVVSGDLEETAALAHSLKGVSSTLGISGVSLLAAKIESAAKDGDGKQAEKSVKNLRSPLSTAVAQILPS